MDNTTKRIEDILSNSEIPEYIEGYLREHIKTLVNEERNEALQGGYNEGYDRGRADGYCEGYSVGKSEGYNEGLRKGREDGITEALRDVTQNYSTPFELRSRLKIKYGE